MKKSVNILLFVLIFALIVVLYNGILPKGRIYGFWEGIRILVLMTISPVIGMGVGNTVRMWLMPDMVYTNGAVEMAKAKIFWAIDPQVTGHFIGLMLISKWIS